MHLHLIKLIILSSCTEMVFSLPLKSFTVAERSTLVLVSLVSCIGIFGVLGACVFCRRRKKKFEKFENESQPDATTAINRTEYPIFRALSTSSPNISRVPAAIVPQTPNNRSSDNLLENDNNNGALSSADLENIENNNANEFIPALHHIPQALLETECFSSSHLTSTTDQTTEITSFSPTENLIPTITDSTSLTSISILMPNDAFGDINFSNTHIQTNNNVDISITSTALEIISEKDSLVNVQNSDDQTECIMSSIESPEYNSVEEALRALDSALEGEDDVSPEEPTTSLECPNFLDKIVEEAKQACYEVKKQQKFDVTTVTLEAQQLVDDILKCARQLVQKIVAPTVANEKQIVDNSVDQVLNEAKGMCSTTTKGQDSFEFLKPFSIKPAPDNYDDVNFNNFSSLVLENTSTPAIVRQQLNNIETENSAKHKLNFEEISSPIVAKNDATFDLLPLPDDANMPKIIVSSSNKDNNNSEDLTTITPLNTPNELIVSTDAWNKIVAKNLMKNQEREDVADLNNRTFEVVQNKTYDKIFEVNDEVEGGGWFLHPQVSQSDISTNVEDITFDVVQDADEDRAKNIAQLRLLLGATLECAQPSQTSSVGTTYSDDNDEVPCGNDTKPTNENYGIEYGDVDQATNIPAPQYVNKMEIILNYNKRSLSPIMEESEEDITNTSRTFIFQNERGIDSTSTGCRESEAIMGVTKNLMASNDTLFNLEDTLCDENIFSPRANSQNEIKTPTNSDSHELPFALKYPLNSISDNFNFSMNQDTPESLPLFLDRIDVNDVLSPDQDLTYTVEEKTCITVKCSGSQNEEERISEISEPDLVSSSIGTKTENDNDLSSIEEDLPHDMCCPQKNNASVPFTDSDSSQSSDVTPKASEQSQIQQNNRQAEKHDEKYDKSEKQREQGFVDSTLKSYSNEINKSKNQKADEKEKVENTSCVSDEGTNVKNADYWNICDKMCHETIDKSTHDSINILLKHREQNHYVVQEIDYECVGDGPMIGINLSGEEDPWVATDIRVVAPNQGILTTSFTVNEWESEEEDSNSSEEFIYAYVRGSNPSNNGFTEINLREDFSPMASLPQTCINVADHEMENANNILWSPHKDQIPVVPTTTIGIKSNVEGSDSDNEEEGEFVPSIWDSTIQPTRSALKSPENALDSSTLQQPKKRRKNVAFKVQKYHSVYEYPKETMELSPAISEPKLLSQTLEKFIEAQQQEPPTPITPSTGSFVKNDDLISQDIDGFMISSSARPFHTGYQFQAQCNTWPGDQGDFSWSQYQDYKDNDSTDDSKMYEESNFIDWPKSSLSSRLGSFSDSAERSDSGVGESADFLSETSPIASMSELNYFRHAKANLKLPLGCITITPPNEIETDTKDKVEDWHEINDKSDSFTKDEQKAVLSTDLDEKDGEGANEAILPTPSCTGSMDSLSSSNSSLILDRGRRYEQNEDYSNRDQHQTKNSTRCKVEATLQDVINYVTSDKEHKNITNEKLSQRFLSARLSDSTDEDSGIENLTRISIQK